MSLSSQCSFGTVKLKMKVPIPRGILLNDLETLHQKVLKDGQSKILDRQLEKKLLAFRACTGKGLDGLTILKSLPLIQKRVQKNKKPFKVSKKPLMQKKVQKNRKHVKVCISKQVLMSPVVCWRLAVLLHELGHALHFFSNRVPINQVVPSHLHHGKCWKNTLNNAVKDSEDNKKLMMSARSLESPTEACVYGGPCPWCGPKNKRKRQVTRNK